MVEAASVGIVVFTAGMVAVLIVGIRQRDTATVVNAIVSIVAVFVPLALEFRLLSLSGQRIDIEPLLPLWIAAAGFLHSLGMVELYERIWWWDHLTHTLSAAFVAAVIYAALVVVLPRSSAIHLSRATTGVLTLLLTFWVGVFWEVIELLAREVGELFEIEPILVHYGWHDTAYDLGFDILGATLIVLADVRVFVPITRQLPDTTEVFLVGSVGVTVIGSLVLALGIGLRRVYEE